MYCIQLFFHSYNNSFYLIKKRSLKVSKNVGLNPGHDSQQFIPRPYHKVIIILRRKTLCDYQYGLIRSELFTSINAKK